MVATGSNFTGTQAASQILARGGPRCITHGSRGTQAVAGRVVPDDVRAIASHVRAFTALVTASTPRRAYTRRTRVSLVGSHRSFHFFRDGVASCAKRNAAKRVATTGQGARTGARDHFRTFVTRPSVFIACHRASSRVATRTGYGKTEAIPTSIVGDKESKEEPAWPGLTGDPAPLKERGRGS